MNRRVAMFPGIGGERGSLLEDILERFEDAQERLSGQIDGGSAMLRSMACHDATVDLSRQWTLHAANLLWWSHQERHDFQAVCGHSMGFYAALVAAGCLSEADSFRAIRLIHDATLPLVGTLPPIHAVQVGFGTSPTLFAWEAVEIVAYNAPDQFVVAAEREVLYELAKRHPGTIVKQVELGLRVPMHSRALRHVAKDLAKAFAEIEIRRPAIPVWSHTEVRTLATPEQLRLEMHMQISSKVRWMEMIRTMARSGFDDFLEIGPGKMLRQMVWKCLPDARVESVEALDRMRNHVLERKALA